MQVFFLIQLHTCMHDSYKHARVPFRKWRQANPFATFDRVAFNYCCAAAIVEVQIELAAELAKFNAMFKAWEKAGSVPALKPTRVKSGNCITRMYERTGWWPLQKNSSLWQQAINSMGSACAPDKHKMSEKGHMFADLGDKRIKIRDLVLKAFQQDFIDRAFAAEEAAKLRTKRRLSRMSVENTYTGKGFCKAEVS